MDSASIQCDWNHRRSLKGKKMNSVREMVNLKLVWNIAQRWPVKKVKYYITRCSGEKWELVTKSHQHVGNNYSWYGVLKGGYKEKRAGSWKDTEGPNIYEMVGLQTVTAAVKLKYTCCLEEKFWQT